MMAVKKINASNNPTSSKMVGMMMVFSAVISSISAFTTPTFYTYFQKPFHTKMISQDENTSFQDKQRKKSSFIGATTETSPSSDESFVLSSLSDQIQTLLSHNTHTLERIQERKGLQVIVGYEYEMQCDLQKNSDGWKILTNAKTSSVDDVLEDWKYEGNDKLKKDDLFLAYIDLSLKNYEDLERLVVDTSEIATKYIKFMKENEDTRNQFEIMIFNMELIQRSLQTVYESTQDVKDKIGTDTDIKNNMDQILNCYKSINEKFPDMSLKIDGKHLLGSVSGITSNKSSVLSGNLIVAKSRPSPPPAIPPEAPKPAVVSAAPVPVPSPRSNPTPAPATPSPPVHQTIFQDPSKQFMPFSPFPSPNSSSSTPTNTNTVRPNQIQSQTETNPLYQAAQTQTQTQTQTEPRTTEAVVTTKYGTKVVEPMMIPPFTTDGKHSTVSAIDEDSSAQQSTPKKESALATKDNTEESSLTNLECVHVQKAHMGWVNDMKIYNFGEEKLMASASNDDAIKLWNLKTKEAFASLNSERDHVYALSLYGNDKNQCLASYSYEGTVKLFNLRHKSLISTLRTTGNNVVDANGLVAFQMPGGSNFVASGHGNSEIKIWDVASRTAMATLKGHARSIYTLEAYEKNGEMYLASGGNDETVKIWSLEKNKLVKSIPFAHEYDVRSLVAFTRNDGKLLLASGGGSDGKIKVWDTDSYDLVATLNGHVSAVNTLKTFQLTEGGDTILVSGSSDGTVMIWNVSEMREVHTIDIGDGVTSLEFYETGDDEGNKFCLITGDTKGNMKYWMETN